MSDIETVNLRVVAIDSDYYALQSINSYLAWDRRTRVMFLALDMDELWGYLKAVPVVEHPDVVVLDADHLGGAYGLIETLNRIHTAIPAAMTMCLAQHIDISLVEAAAKAGARAYLLKQEVRLQLAAAIVYARDHDFVVTASIARATRDIFHLRLHHASILPDQREYPEMTDRIRQAIQLCVIEGMPAQLAAHEMGISLHTIRGYIKEGYRILETYDQSEYPTEMTPQERAFMRFTALADEEDLD
jgi:DNA-binding NarL/FixJ family response regulator